MAEESLESLRPMLFSLAYRMLGSVAEAEDVVQEAFLRQQRALRQGTKVDSPKAFLSAIVTRLSIDQLRSARARREVYVGEWLPEPLLTDDDPRLDPAQHAEQADSLSLAFLVLLEQLTPVERAVFLLHDVEVREHVALLACDDQVCREVARQGHVDVAIERDERHRFGRVD